MQEFEPTDRPPTAIPLARRALSLALQALAVCVALWPMLRGEFVYDDVWLVAQNPSLASFQQMWHSLGGSYWDFLDAHSSQYVGYWRPLTTIALFIGHSLGNGAPLAFHVISLVLHLIAIALVTALAWRLTRNYPVAFLIGLCFGLHPVQVEPVAWISSVNDPLQGVFSLGTLLAFVAWRERGSQGLPLSSAALFLCALLAKESSLAVFPLLFVLDFGRTPRAGKDEPLSRSLRPFVRPYATMFAAFALYYIARVAIFGDYLAGFERSTGQLGLTLGREMSLRVELFGGALALMVWPQTLNLFRDTRPEIPWSDATLWIDILCIAVWLVALVWAWRKRARPLLTGLLIIPAALLPALLRIEALGRFVLSERYLYISMFGFALFAVAAVAQFTSKFSIQRVGLLLMLIVALLFGWRAHERTFDWQDERTLFARSCLDNPKSPYVFWGLGRVVLQDYKRSEELEFLREAKQDFMKSLDLGSKQADGTHDPEVLVTGEDRLQANLGLGWCFFFAALRNFDDTTLDEALAVLEHTLTFFPKSYETMTAIGMVLKEQGDLVKAKERFTTALAINPKHLEAWYQLGRLEMRKGDPAAAKTAFEHALALKSDDVETLVLYADLLGDMGETAAAQRALDLAQSIAPDDFNVLMGMGTLAAKQRQGGDALAWFDRVLQSSPKYGPAYLQKAKVLYAMGQPERAITAFQRACELMPRNFEAHYNLGALLANQGGGKDALPYLQRAIEVEPNNPRADDVREQIRKINEH